MTRITKVLTGCTCLGALMLGTPVLAQGLSGNNGFQNSGPSFASDEAKHALVISVRASLKEDGQLLSDAVVAVQTMDGQHLKAVPLADGTFFMGNVGNKTTIEVTHPIYGQGTLDLTFNGRSFMQDVSVFMSDGLLTSNMAAGRQTEGPVCGAGAGDCCAPNGTPGCDDVDCCNTVCGLDPFCCDTEWDQVCSDAAAVECGMLCGGGGGGCGDGDCCAANGTPGCDDQACCDIVCGLDAFCCDTEWDQVCADAAAAMCTDLCGGGGGGCNCTVDCPAGNSTEGEACGADTNGGCNSAPVAFEPATCGESFCGTAWADGGNRDTDWYLISHGGGVITGTVTSVLPTVCFVLDGIGACAPAVVGTIGSSSDCGNVVPASADLPPGDYVVFVAAGNPDGSGIFEGFPCGSNCENYTLDIECVQAAPMGACCLSDNSCVITSEADCNAAGGSYQGDDTDCGFAGYVASDCGNAFEDISATGTFAPTATDTDDGGDVIAIGFDFNFFGSIQSNVGVASNGYLTFGATLGDFTNDPIPNPAEPNSVIAPYWDDWSPNQAGDVQTQTLGTAPNRRFIAQWTGVPHFNDGGSTTFQAILFEGSNDIEFRYADIIVSSPSVGVENADGTVGTSVAGAASGGCISLAFETDGGPCGNQIPTGACCLSDGSCVIATEADCNAAGGSYQGDDTACPEAMYVAESCGNALMDISGTGTLAPTASTSDDNGDVVGLGFTFNFFGVDHTDVGVASNGYLTFGADLGDFSNDPIPTDTDPNDLIAPLWDDWSPNQAGEVHTQTIGSAPDRQFIAQWTGVPHFDDGGSSTFQVILSEGSNCIEYRYGDILISSPTVGIENVDATDGLDAGPASSNGCISICPVFDDICNQGPAPINVDIKPGQCPNPFHTTTNALARLDVAIVGKGDFDVNDVDVSSISISRADGMGGSVSPSEAGVDDVATPFGGVACDCHDLGGDGIADLVLYFSRVDMEAALGLNPGDTVELVINGNLVTGEAVAGSDCVEVD